MEITTMWGSLRLVPIMAVNRARIKKSNIMVLSCNSWPCNIPTGFWHYMAIILLVPLRVLSGLIFPSSIPSFLMSAGFTSRHYTHDGEVVEEEVRWSHRLQAQSELSRIVQGHKSCFYQGHVLEQPGWTVTMSTCRGLRYAFWLWRKRWCWRPIDGAQLSIPCIVSGDLLVIGTIERNSTIWSPWSKRAHLWVLQTWNLTLFFSFPLILSTINPLGWGSRRDHYCAYTAIKSELHAW